MNKKSMKIRLGAAVLALTCLGTGVALAAEAGSENDPLITLSYLNETVLPKLLEEVEASAEVRQAELTEQFQKAIAQEDGSGGTSSSYIVVTLNAGQTLNLDLGSEVMLRVGSATGNAVENPALVDMTTGDNLNSGESLVKNHLYLATMTDHSITAGGSTVKVLVRGGYSVSA